MLVVLRVMSRLMCDVDMAEQWELRRLEDGGSPREWALRTPSWPGSPRSAAPAEVVTEEEMEMASSAMGSKVGNQDSHFFR